MHLLNAFFGFDRHGTTFSREFVAGLTTFTTMSYIVVVNPAILSAAGIPVISMVHGSSTAGGAYQTGLADYVVMVRGRSKVFPTRLICRASGRGLRCRAIGARLCGSRLRRHCTGRCWGWGARAGRACSWFCRRGLRPC